MGQGLQVWNSSGSLVLDSPTRLGVRLGSVLTGTTNGSLSVPGFAKGVPFCVAVTSGSLYAGEEAPVVSISGTTLTWSYTGGRHTPRRAVNITYGVF